MSNDRVAAENSAARRTRYTRMLGEAQRELQREQDQRRDQQNDQQNRDRNGRDREDRDDQGHDANGSAGGAIETGNDDSGLVETPEARHAEAQPKRRAMAATDPAHAARAGLVGRASRAPEWRWRCRRQRW
ncbi:MAG: hypothetical protein R3D84_17600 [Paracoccaceae bacterium]